MVRVIEFVNVRTHYTGVGFINMYVRFDFTSKSIILIKCSNEHQFPTNTRGGFNGSIFK